MSAWRVVRSVVIASFLVVGGAGFAHAQAAAQTYEPKVGQAGKDVVWVPTPQSLVDKMLEMANLQPTDYLVDLGSGDGRTVITAAKRGVRALGIEYNPDMVALSQRNAAQAGVARLATFAKADIFTSDFSDATVITMFLLPDINLKLRPKLLEMKPGTRLVSNSFTMGEWEADRTETITVGCTSWCTALLWIVPAKVAGVWRVGNADLTLKQEFQKLSGTLGTQAISDAKMNGDEITFSVGTARYTGKVTGATMQGTVRGGPGGSWTARKSAG